MFNWFNRTTVSKITESLGDMIDRLEAHVTTSTALSEFHQAESDLHDYEAQAAQRIKQKIAELLA